MADAPTLELRIQENSEKAVSGILALAASLSALKLKASEGLGLGKVIKQLETFNQKFQAAFSPDSVNNITKVADALSKLANFQTGKMPDISKEMSNVTDFTPVTSQIDNAKQGFAEFNEAIESAGESAGSASVSMSAVNSDMAEMASNAGKANTETRELEKNLNGVKQSAEGSSGGFKKFSKQLDAALMPLSRIIKAFGRIMFYRVIRSVLREIAKGFSEGIANVRAYSSAINGTFNSAMTSAEATLLKVKNSLGAALAPALEAVIPVLQTLASWFITVINLANQLIALLSGKSQWTRATDASAESIEKVGKAAGGASSKLKGLLAGFDELNIIQSQSGGGGGGGGASDMGNYEDMFEEVFEFDDRIKPLVNWIKANGPLILDIVKNIGIAFATWRLSRLLPGDLGEVLRYAVGLYIAFNGLKDAYQAFIDQWNNGVDLENMKQLIKSGLIVTIGLGLAFGIAGIGAGLLFEGVSLAIAPIKELIETGKLSAEASEQLGWAFVFAAAGATVLATRSLKAGIGVGIAAYFIVDALKDITEQWNNGVTIENMRSLFNKLKWVVLGLGLAFGTKGIGAGAVIAGLAEMVAPLKELVEVGSLSETAFQQLETGIGLLSAGITALSGNPWVLVIGGIIAGVTALIHYWPEVVNWWESDAQPFLQNMWDTVVTTLTQKWEGIKKTVAEKWQELGEWWNKTVEANPFLKGIRDIFSEIGAFIERYRADPQGWWDGVWASISGWFTSKVEAVKKKASEIWNSWLEADPTLKKVVDAASAAIEDIKALFDDPETWFTSKWEGIVSAVSGWWNRIAAEIDQKARADSFLGPIITWVEETWPKIKGFFEDPWAHISAMFTTLAQQAADFWDSLVESDPTLKATIDWFVAAIEEIKTFFADPFAYISNKWEQLSAAVGEWWNGIAEQIVTKARADQFLGPVITFIEESWAAIERFAQDPIGSIEAAWNGLKTWFHNTIVVPFQNFFINIGNNAIDIVNQIIDGINSIDVFGLHFNIPRVEKLKLAEEILPEGAVPIEVEPVVSESIEDTIQDYLYDEANDVEIVFEPEVEIPKMEVDAIDTTNLTQGMANTAASIKASVNDIIKSLNSLGSVGANVKLNYSGGRMGGGLLEYIRGFASGGFVGTGDMFIARESGPELVGRIGSRTAVANNDQIVQGVSAGVANGQAEQNSLLRQQNDLLRQIVAKSGRVEAVPSADWGRFVRRSSEMYANNTGL